MEEKSIAVRVSDTIVKYPFPPLFDVLVETNTTGEGPAKIIKLKQPNFISVMVKIKGKDKFLMVRQKRRGINKFILEPVCGLVDKGERPIHAAAREVSEELGLNISVNDLFTVTSKYTNPSLDSNQMYAYACSLNEEDLDLKLMRKNQRLDAGENVSIEFVENISETLRLQNQILSLYNNVIMDGVRLGPEIILNTE